MNEQFNVTAINKFRNSLVEYQEYGNDGFQFSGIVKYTACNKTITDIFEIKLIIGGFSPEVKLDVEEVSKKIKRDTHHKDFNPAFGTFKFDEESTTLIIESSSSKMGGDYIVEITEN